MKTLNEEVWKRGLTKSKGEATRLIFQGAIKVNGRVITNPMLEVSPQAKIEKGNG